MTQFNKAEVMSMMNTKLDNNLNLQATNTVGSTMAYACDSIGAANYGTNAVSCWHYWQDCYYPTVIRESYPVYVREQAQDKGKKAYEIIKVLKDKKLAKLEKVADFIDLMDALIGIL